VVTRDQASRINLVIEACGDFFLGKVAVLDPLVAQQVAAGEVVDRPASVVKELSENALDADATRVVEVEIADGGRERMLVRDNDSGMSEEDAMVCVLSHATNKIRTAGEGMRLGRAKGMRLLPRPRCEAPALLGLRGTAKEEL
jgi:DNA mismatch repair protein MutL